MKKTRAALLPLLLEERFPRDAIEDELVNLAEPETVRIARVLQVRIEARSCETPEIRAGRRHELAACQEPTREQMAGVPPRPVRQPPSALIGRSRAGMDPVTLAAVRTADRDRQRTRRRAS